MGHENGWRTSTLGEVLELKRGYDLPKKDRKPGAVPIISSSGFSGTHVESKVDSPGVVTGRYGTIGEVHWVDEPYWPLNTALYVRDFKGNDRKFVYYFLQTIDYFQYSDKAAVPGVNRNHLHQAQVVVPPVDQQRAIAHILGALDDKIELNRRMNETLEAVARAVFKSWFVDFDPVRAKLNGRTPHGMDAETAALFPERFEHVDGELLPAGWSYGSLSSAAEVVMGTSPKSDTYNVDGVGTPLVNGPVEFGDYFPVRRKWTTAPTRFSKARDLIFCVRGSTTGRRIISDGEYCLGRGVCAMRSTTGHQEFINRSIDSVIDVMLSRTTGSVFPSLSAPQIKGFEILLPPEKLVHHYCGAAGPITDLIASNVRESQALADLRDTLLPKLLSGELSVPASEEAVEGVA